MYKDIDYAGAAVTAPVPLLLLYDAASAATLLPNVVITFQDVP